MTDLYLRAADEAALKTALPWLLDAEGNWLTASHRWAFDPVGPIATSPATTDEQGTLLTAPVFDSRFHANLRLLDETLAGDVPAEMIVAPEPATPTRVWA